MFYYLSLQYSAIQKTVMRHNRLWSIAGISQGLAHLNEIDLMRIVENENGGKVLIAGGGKFTARFNGHGRAESARQAIIQEISTTFPMLEFQTSTIVEAATFLEAKKKGILDQINDQKHSFRGYATSYLPHLAVCAECGEYPAEQEFPYTRNGTTIYLCRTCDEARNRVWTNLAALEKKKGDSLTTLERIYAGYRALVPTSSKCKLALDFSDLFPEDNDDDQASKRRMAVWFSDLNDMNQKVPIWLSQKDDEILDMFNTVKEVNISIVVKALADTFSKPEEQYLPFRLVVAGGDDLRMVMPEEYVLLFTEKLARAVNEKILELDGNSENPLNTNWLQNKAIADENGIIPTIKPYSFGASFVITSLHTPFKRIHEAAEDLMSKAKKVTDRLGNSINWRIMAEEHSVSDMLLKFERPLFITKPTAVPAEWDNRLTFSDYLDLSNKFGNISSSHRFAIIERLIQYRDNPERFTTEMKKLDGATRSKSFSGLLTEPRLKRGHNLDPARVATLFELLSIKHSEVMS